MAEAKFCLGKLVATPGAIQALADAGQDAAHFLSLHQSGSWGDLGQEDRQLNDQAIEHDRSATTILLPEEY
jgi:hypothetical protein